MILADRLAYASRWRHRALSEKALLSFGLLVLALALPVWPASVLVAGLATGFALLAGTGWRNWLRLAVPPMAFAATGGAALLVTVDGSGLAWAPGGVQAATAVVGRALAAMCAMLLLTATTPTPDLVRGMRRLGLPPEFAELTLSIYRFVFILLDTAAAMHAGQAARLGTVGWRGRIRSAGMLAGALLPRAMERARRQEIGLAARGFDGSLRTLGAQDRADPAVLAGIALVLAGVAGIGW